MDKNFSISFRIIENKIPVMDILRVLDKKTNKFFDYMISRTSQDYYLSSIWKERVIVGLEISEGTYWRRLKKLTECGILIKEGAGIYKLNTKLLRIITKVEEESRKQRIHRNKN